MLMTMDSALALGFRPTGSLLAQTHLLLAHSLFSTQGCRSPWSTSSSDGHVLGGYRRQRLLDRGTSELDTIWNGGLHRRRDGCSASSRNYLLPARVRAASDHDAGSLPDPPKSTRKLGYHPFEEIEEPTPMADGKDARLTDAETARTIIEVNSKATLLFSGLTDDEVHENIIWPDLPYLTDEHGDVYFEVHKDDDILQSLIDDKLLHVVIGLDDLEMLTEMEVSGPSDFDFGIEEVTSEEDDSDDDYEEDPVSIIEDEVGDIISSEVLGDWANFETLHGCHPMYFAKKMAEAVSNIHLDWMDQPSASIIVQGHLRPAFVEESTVVKKHSLSGDLDKDQSLQIGATFYKLEMLGIQLVSSYGRQSFVKVQDFRKARPDVIAHSAANIVSRLKAGGEKITQALKLLCWRHKGIHVEEAALIGVDSLGFDVRVCSGTQVQTLRVSFNSRATSEFSAERQLYDLLFPKFQNKQRKWHEAHKKEC